MQKFKMVNAILLGALLFSSSSVFAQVKIGTNPTVIDANSNLEVEASTASRKVQIDKTTGKVTIKDGSEGNNKVLTSDANGIATWLETGRSSTTIKAIGAGSATNLNGVNTSIMNGSSVNFNLASAKTVFINFIGGYDDTAQAGGGFAPYYTFTIYIDGSPTDILMQLQEPGGSAGSVSFTLSGVLDLSAGSHVLDVRGIRSFNNGIAPNTNYSFSPLSQRTFVTYFN